jgi:hypothetical protein
MGRVTPNRKTAEALRKILQELESDPTVDSTGPAFVQLKCALLQRLMDCELDSAETPPRIHPVDSPEDQSPEPAEMPKPAIF